MNIQVHSHGPLMYAQIDDLYTEYEIGEIKKELTYLETIKEPANATNSAIVEGGMLKKGGGVFVDDVYTNRKFSILLKLNRKIFDQRITGFLSNHSCFFDHLAHSTVDSTLINFYGADDEYRSHRDIATFTALTFFKIGNFDGGQLAFDEYGVSIDPIEGRAVVFPGCVLHSAKPTIAEPGNFRVTMAQFIGYRQNGGG